MRCIGKPLMRLLSVTSVMSLTKVAALLLGVVVLASCGGGSDGAVSSDENSQSSSPTPVPSPSPSPAPGIAPLPTVDDDGNARWSFGPEQGSLTLIVQPFARMPLGSDGRPPRLNAMAYAGNRLFISDELDGRILEITSGSPSLFFDVAEAIRTTTGRQLDRSSSWHAGLRSFAFHPDFANNGKLYVAVMETRPPDPQNYRYLSTSSTTIVADSVLIEFTVNPQTYVVDPASYRSLFRVGMPVYDHPIKQIGFNPDARPGGADYGLLYIAHGDGSEASATAGGGLNNDALGKILRIDPLASDDQPYLIPDSNPFVGNEKWIDEIYSVGHRNPHHIAFVGDGQLLVAEPGRDNIEELNLVTGGQSFGWPAREGTYVHLQRSGLVVGIDQLPADDASYGYVYPVVQIGHEGPEGAVFVRQAIGGGYPGKADTVFENKYLYCEFAATGKVYYSDLDALRAATTTGDPNRLTQAPILEAKIAFDEDGNPSTPPLAMASMVDVVISSPDFSNAEGIRADIRFGRGSQGELYLFSKRNRMVYLITNSR